MSFKEALFGFLGEPVRDVGSNHKVAAISLKIECWLTFIGGILIAVAGLIFSVVALVGGTVAGNVIEEFGWWDGANEAGAAAGAFLFVLLMVFTIVATVFMGLWLWWTNTTYLKWNRTEDGAITWANVFGGVLTFFSLLSFMGAGGGGNIIGLVIGVLILIFANLANSKGELDGGTTPPSGGADPA